MGRPPNENLYLNYLLNLEAAGGGLVLGTGSASDFARGINDINAAIGFDLFQDDHFWYPYALVDVTATLMSYPNDATASTDHIWDDLTSSDVPSGVQPNGQVLDTVAWHGGLIDRPAISVTLTVTDQRVPEPSAISLLLTGLFAFVRRRC
jgi:hypothetical protein